MASEGRVTVVTGGGPREHPVVSREEWLSARTALLAKEKELSRLRDELGRQRRALPFVKLEKTYVFDGPGGKVSLADLFGGNSQLIVYHFMFSPVWDQGCPHCSFWADHFDGVGVHLQRRDAAFAAVSRAPIGMIEPFKKRMGWGFPWVSSSQNEFNYDFGVSFTPEQNRTGTAVYNYARGNAGGSDREGASVFYRDGRGSLYHTYSCYARGIDVLNGTYHFLDLAPKGRDEEGFESPQDWVRHHDRYGE